MFDPLLKYFIDRACSHGIDQSTVIPQDIAKLVEELDPLKLHYVISHTTLANGEKINSIIYTAQGYKNSIERHLKQKEWSEKERQLSAARRELQEQQKTAEQLAFTEARRRMNLQGKTDKEITNQTR